MGIYKIRVFFLAAALSLVCSTQAAWAAGWVQEQDGQWYYEDGQERLTGWNMILPGFPDRCLGAETPDRSASSLLSPGEQAEGTGPLPG